MKTKTLLLVLAFAAMLSCTLNAQQVNNEVTIIGEMKNVMWKGQLYGNISIDTIAVREHLYGLGPVEHLTGEILIFDGKSYKSTVSPDLSMIVEETYSIKAPFFGYANIPIWKEHLLPDNIVTMNDLEIYLDEITKSSPRPFMFKLSGLIESATIHIVNLPEGANVSSPDDAHQGQIKYKLADGHVDILGFFSTEHKSIFTHHDTFLHMHLITTDRKSMGHLDDVQLMRGAVKLYLPAE